MQLIEGNLVNEVITTDQPDYDLNGMVCPTFQNLGLSEVMFNGLILKQDESYTVNVPTIVLRNSTDIRFLSETDRRLVVSFVKPKS